mmetsp:Transcript_4326/g.10483  ORF Transcript_4326/g.10483 Transcript_4326/m.10483 type:complete len:245 (+) Transcript_4326:1075-1809(+)
MTPRGVTTPRGGSGLATGALGSGTPRGVSLLASASAPVGMLLIPQQAWGNNSVTAQPQQQAELAARSKSRPPSAPLVRPRAGTSQAQAQHTELRSAADLIGTGSGEANGVSLHVGSAAAWGSETAVRMLSVAQLREEVLIWRSGGHPQAGWGAESVTRWQVEQRKQIESEIMGELASEAVVSYIRKLEDERDRYRAAHRLETNRSNEMRVAINSQKRVVEKSQASAVAALHFETAPQSRAGGLR